MEPLGRRPRVPQGPEISIWASVEGAIRCWTRTFTHHGFGQKSSKGTHSNSLGARDNGMAEYYDHLLTNPTSSLPHLVDAPPPNVQTLSQASPARANSYDILATLRALNSIQHHEPHRSQTLERTKSVGDAVQSSVVTPRRRCDRISLFTTVACIASEWAMFMMKTLSRNRQPRANLPGWQWPLYKTDWPPSCGGGVRILSSLCYFIMFALMNAVIYVAVIALHAYLLQWKYGGIIFDILWTIWIAFAFGSIFIDVFYGPDIHCLRSASLVLVHKVFNTQRMRRIFKGLGNVKRAIASFAGPFAVRTSKLPGFINGIEVLAFPDTGAEGNVMSFSFAEKHHLKILKGSQQCSVFKLANGRKVRSIGQVDVTWAFEGSSLNEYDLRFNVLPFCSHPVLIGNELLKETKTMSLHRDRLRACVSFRWPVQFANLLGSARERLRGKLNGKTVLALPDSGCEPNLLSEAYVKKRGLTIQKDFRRRAVLQFADGSIQETAGQVKTKWRFSDSQEPMEIVFDVLRGCPFDVVIGRGVLDATEAYVKHAGCFIETDSKTDTSDLNCVTYHTSFLQRFRRTKSVDPVVASKQADDEKRTKELDRRAQADRLINSVTDSVEKASERDRESERRRLWNEARARNRTSRSSTAVAAPSQPSLSYPPPDVSSTMPSRSAAVGA